MPDPAAAGGLGDVDRGLADPGVALAGRGRHRPRSSRRPRRRARRPRRGPAATGPAARRPWAARSRRSRCGSRGPRRRSRAPASMSASVTGRTATSAGRSVGQHGRDDSVPMMTSAACGRPVQHAALTDTIEELPTLSTTTKPTLRSSSTWWEQVDWLMPSCRASSPTRSAPAGRGGQHVQQPDPGRVGEHGEPLGVVLGLAFGERAGVGRRGMRWQSTVRGRHGTSVPCLHRR